MIHRLSARGKKPFNLCVLGKDKGKARATSVSFFSIYQQGFVRVAACTPKCEVANPQYNLAQTLELARVSDQDGVALMVFPELGLSGYAIDDLLGQAALLDRVESALTDLVAATGLS